MIKAVRTRYVLQVEIKRNAEHATVSRTRLSPCFFDSIKDLREKSDDLLASHATDGLLTIRTQLLHPAGNPVFTRTTTRLGENGAC
ncbi:MAG: hypothetical protein Q8P49_02900, partial [Candidatus Liptonbacteria bacterium]|nr:hypothetical protein [Candidatus Liptonbacteria bacterium]